MTRTKGASGLGQTFAQSAGEGRKRRRSASAKTFSIRLNEDERQCLRQAAGKLPLGTYIRKTLLGDVLPSRKSGRIPKKLHRPTVDQVSIARVLAMLGRSDVYASLSGLAKAAVMGVLPVAPEILEELKGACADVRAMRALLMTALATGSGDRHDPCR